jgi:uncharacterized protein (DUF885 family)
MPTSRDEYDKFMNRLSEIPRAMGSALSSTADGWGDEHIHPSVIAQTQEHAQAYNSMADTGDEANAEHKTQHSLWLAD